MLIRNIWLLCIGLFSCTSISISRLQEGDIIFQNLDCGDLCYAIESVTEGKHGLDFSHLGLIIEMGDSLAVIESIGEGVVTNSISDFTRRSSNKHYVGRIKKSKASNIPKATHFAKSKIGVPYDDDFLYNNEKYYCSELIYDCFVKGASDSTIFSLEPMTFVSSNQPRVDTIWQDYYDQLGIAVPEGQPGINPAGMTRSPALKWLKILKK